MQAPRRELFKQLLVRLRCVSLCTTDLTSVRNWWMCSCGSAEPPQNQLWVEKHKPETIAQLVGNGKLIADLRKWISEWQRCVLAGAPVGVGTLD